VFQKFQQYFFLIQYEVLDNQTQNCCSSCYRTKIKSIQVILIKEYIWHLNVRVLQKFQKYFFLIQNKSLANQTQNCYSSCYIVLSKKNLYNTLTLGCFKKSKHIFKLFNIQFQSIKPKMSSIV
jgi:hypothetical protein